jgi:hypothetical protein
MQLTVTFDVATDPNIDQVNVQNRIAQAAPNLPPDVNTFGLTMRKATGFPMLIVSLSSPKDTYDALFLANYANINIIDALYRVPGVGDVRIFGAGDYAMRIWVRPDRLAQLGLTVPELVRAVQQQSTVNPSGQIGAQPAPPGQEITYTVRAQGRLQTADEFAAIAVRSNPDGSVVRLKDVARIELGALNYQQIGRVNGQPGWANEFLLEDQLRGKWNFNGYVVSDCDAISDIAMGHHFVPTVEEAAAVSMKRGVDLDCTFTPQPKRYIDAVKKGLLPEKDLDASVKRLFRARFELGMFDPPAMVKYAQIPYSANDTEEHRQLALKAARESIVLLKNDGTLPLKGSGRKILVVGPLADQVRVLEGNYNGTPSHIASALDGIRKQFASDTVTFAPGTTFLRDAILVPASVLTTPDGQPGLKAEYFKGMELAGSPAVTRIESSISFNLDEDTPVAEVGAEHFSARWTGFLTPAQSGKFQLGFNGDDGFRVWFDGKLLVDDWNKHGASTKTAGVEFEKGHKYPIKVEYFQDTRGAVARLLWSDENQHPLEDAIDAAKHADVVIAVVGITSSLEGEEMPVELPGFKGGDRTSLDLPKQEEDLLEAVAATGKPLIVALYNGSALAVNWASEHANAILDAWYPGEEGGRAIAETCR